MLIVRIFIFHRHKTPMNKEFQEEGERLKDKKLFCYRLILSFLSLEMIDHFFLSASPSYPPVLLPFHVRRHQVGYGVIILFIFFAHHIPSFLKIQAGRMICHRRQA